MKYFLIVWLAGSPPQEFTFSMLRDCEAAHASWELFKIPVSRCLFRESA